MITRNAKSHKPKGRIDKVMRVFIYCIVVFVLLNLFYMCVELCCSTSCLSHPWYAALFTNLEYNLNTRNLH